MDNITVQQMMIYSALGMIAVINDGKLVSLEYES